MHFAENLDLKKNRNGFKRKLKHVKKRKKFGKEALINEIKRPASGL